MGADDVVEQRAERLEHEVQRPRDQQRPVAELAVLAHPPYPGREGLLQEQVAGELRGFPAKFPEVGVLVAAVEPAQEVAPVDHVEREHPRRFEQGAHREAGTLGQVHVPRGEPGVGVDDVGRHQGVLQVEDGELAVGREHRPLATFFAR